MWFKHLHLYRVHDLPVLPLRDLGACLAESSYRPLGGSEAKRIGWAAPAGRGSEQLVHQVKGHRLLSALLQERILPASVVREELEARVSDREASEGRPLRRQEKQALKEQIYEEFLPRAFVRTQRIDLWWDTERQLIAVNAASRARAEDVLDLLRQTLGSLKVTPLATKVTPVRAMTDWLRQPEDRPAWLEIGDQVQLKATGDESTIAGRHADLDAEDIQAALEAGRQVTRMAITIDERVSCVLHDDLAIKSLRFADGALDEAAQVEDDGDPVVRLEADFTLMTGALRASIEQLIHGLGGETQPAAATP
ncbi:recombination-associated protein RdgC [Modicisalibacter coralii]|uniref:recombination-associated protein RdgC n=1 Tax=Modicisalibacter coralii TaxID=2304602 RepID=UPI00100B1447|nr:recombination-associated protein RdgC [Halomonas coralii]